MTEKRYIFCEEEIGYLTTLAQLEATLILSLPIRITYENWCFLHKIVDGDKND